MDSRVFSLIALGLAVFFLFGCLDIFAGPKQPQLKEDKALVQPPAPPTPAPKAVVNTTPSFPKTETAPPTCLDDNCRWREIGNLTNPLDIEQRCQKMLKEGNRDLCEWFLAGVLDDKGRCEYFSDVKYRPVCTQELNGQMACSPSRCSNCLSKSSCLEMPTCDYSTRYKIPCRQQTALYGR